MKIILKKDVSALGDAGEIVDVKPGYARNYLVPKGYAVPATGSNLKQYEQEKEAQQRQEEKEKEKARALADELSKVSLTAPIQVGEEDKVFGAITNQNIADLLKEKGYDIDRKKIQLDEPLKELGVFEVPIKLYKDVEAIVKVWIVRE